MPTLTKMTQDGNFYTFSETISSVGDGSIIEMPKLKATVSVLLVVNSGTGSIYWTNSSKTEIEAGTATWKISDDGIVSADIDTTFVQSITSLKGRLDTSGSVKIIISTPR